MPQNTRTLEIFSQLNSRGIR